MECVVERALWGYMALSERVECGCEHGIVVW